MAIAAISTAGFSQYIEASSSLSASQQAFQALANSLASGNLTAAQAAFNTYQQINQGLSQSSGSSSSSGSSQLATDLTALGSAISSGDLSTAQSAFATVQSDLKSAQPPALTAALNAVAQSVSTVESLLQFPDSSSDSSTTTVDPLTSLLYNAYGLNPSTGSSNDSSLSTLESEYGSTNSTSSGSGSSSATAASSGNNGSAASVNVYA